MTDTPQAGNAGPTVSATPGEAPDRASIRVMVVDDHSVVRAGLSVVLGAEDDIVVVGEAGTGDEAVVRAVETLPDVVLMDVRMPNGSGIEAARRIKDVAPSVKIIMVTVSDEDADLFEAIKAGASGYLLKSVDSDELCAGVRAVAANQSLISPSLAAKLMAEYARAGREDDQSSVTAPRLTPRELEVLRLVARGLNNRAIAKELFIAENTVKNHIRNILEKLQLHSRIQAVMYAVQQGHLKPTDLRLDIADE